MKRSVLLYLVSFIFLIPVSNGQWSRKFSTRGVSFGETMARDNSGNIYVAGTFVCDLVFENDSLPNISCGSSVTPPLPVAQFDGYIVKYDQDGNYIWSQQIIGSSDNSIFEIKGITADASGNIFLTGSYNGTLDFSGNILNNTVPEVDFFVAKYQSDGTLDWVISNFARRSNSYAQANSITADATGNCYVTGALKDTVIFNGDQDTLSFFNQELFISKFNSLGDFQWVITSAGDSTASSAEILDIQADADANLFVTGTFKDTVDFGGDTLHTIPAGSTEIFVAKYSNTGNLKWVLQEDASSSNGLSLDPSGEYLLIAGQFTSTANIGGDAHTTSAGNIGAFIARYDTSGVYDWSQICTTGAADSAATGRSVSVDDRGDAYLVGNFGKKNSTNPVITSGTESTTGNGSMDIFVAKFNNTGTVQWIRTLGKTREDDCKDVIATDSLNIYIAGYFADTIRIDSNLTVNDYQGYNGYAAELDACAFFEASVSATGSTTLCLGDSVLLQSTVTGTGYTYQWQKDGTFIPSANSSTYYASSEGSYRVVITSASFPCVRYSLPVSVVVNPLPSITIIKGRPSIFCTGDSVTYAANIGYTYQWLRDDTPIGGATEYSYAGKVSGIYKVALENTFGCRDTSAADTVTVYSYPTATISPAGRFVICSGDSVAMDAGSVSGYTYQWYRNNVELTNDTLPVYQAKTDGYYKVKVSNEIGCSAISEQDTLATMSSPSAVISHSEPLTYCADHLTTLYSNTGLGLTFQWRLNGVDIPSANGTTYQPAVSGDYSLAVENTIGCTTISPEVTVTVNPQPDASLTTSATTICSGDSVTLEAPSGVGYTYRWQKNFSDIPAEVSEKYYAKTSGSYRLILTDNNSCSDTSSAVPVIVNGLPSATLTALGDTIFCSGDQVELKANPGTNLSYQWYESGNPIALATSISYTALTSGIYSVEVTNSAGCTRESSAKTVVVYSIPDASVTPDGPLTFCEGDSVVLEAPAGIGYTYQWKKNGFNISGAVAGSYIAKTSGDYTVLVSVNATCQNTSSIQTVTVNPVTKPVLTVNGTNVSTSFYASYQWNKDGVPISGATNQIYNAIESGKYTVTVPSSNGCPATSDTAVICVPAPSINVSGSLLTASDGAGYQWYLEGFQITNAVSKNYLANTSGNYKVKVRLSDGCESFSEEVLVCIPAPTITVGDNNVLTASAGVSFQWYLDGEEIPGATTQIHVADTSGSYTVRVVNEENCESEALPVLISGINDAWLSGGFSIYPNPADRILNLTMNNSLMGAVTITVLDLPGTVHQKVILDKTDYSWNAFLNTEHLKEGLYILRIECKDQVIYSKFEKVYGW